MSEPDAPYRAGTRPPQRIEPYHDETGLNATSADRPSIAQHAETGRNGTWTDRQNRTIQAMPEPDDAKPATAIPEPDSSYPRLITTHPAVPELPFHDIQHRERLSAAHAPADNALLAAKPESA